MHEDNVGDNFRDDDANFVRICRKCRVISRRWFISATKRLPAFGFLSVCLVGIKSRGYNLRNNDKKRRKKLEF